MTKMPWPVVPIKFCEHLAGKKPSEITTPMLRRLSCGGMMHHCAARAVEAMIAAAKADGVKLTPTSSGDTFRSIEQQRSGFVTRYQKAPLAGATTRTWNGEKWYLKPGNAYAYIPFTSFHHGWILAELLRLLTHSSSPEIWMDGGEHSTTGFAPEDTRGGTSEQSFKR